jgi:hypothetical protein
MGSTTSIQPHWRHREPKLSCTKSPPTALPWPTCYQQVVYRTIPRPLPLLPLLHAHHCIHLPCRHGRIFPKQIPFPQTSTDDYLRQAAEDIVSILTTKNASNPTLDYGSSITNTYLHMVQILQRATALPITGPTSALEPTSTPETSPTTTTPSTALPTVPAPLPRVPLSPTAPDLAPLPRGNYHPPRKIRHRRSTSSSWTASYRPVPRPKLLHPLPSHIYTATIRATKYNDNSKPRLPP